MRTLVASRFDGLEKLVMYGVSFGASGSGGATGSGGVQKRFQHAGRLLANCQ
jgi:hypothetical protein